MGAAAILKRAIGALLIAAMIAFAPGASGQRIIDTIPSTPPVVGMIEAAGNVSPVASWDASTGTLTSLAALVTATSAGLATMFDSTGKLTYAPNNLLTYSNTFDNAAWTKLNLTVSSGVTDPFGGSAAFTITATAANAQIFQNINSRFISSAKTVQTIWIKRRTGSGTVNYYDPAGNNTHALSLTGSWQQFTYASSETANWIFAGNILLVTSGDAIDIYAATATAVTYETTPRTADQVITTSAAYYGPRIDYTYSSTPGLLVEGARTNIALQSALASGWGVSSVTVSTDGTLAPDGATAAKKILASAGSAAHEIYNTATVAVSASTTYTNSVFVKKGNHRYIFLNIEDSTTAHAVVVVFDLDNPSAATQSYTTGSGSLTSSSINSVGGGWYRVSLTGQISTATAAYLCYGLVGAATGNTGAEPTFTAAGTEYAYFTGVQLEAGSSATSYIPTAASSVTRAADSPAAAAYSSNPAIIQYRAQSTGARARKKLTTFSSISSETAEWIEAIRVYPVGTSSAYLDAHLTVDGAW